MKARAHLIVEQDSTGRQITSVQTSDPPLLLRQRGDVVWIVGGAAGPIGGDDLALSLEVGRGARIWVRSVAATMALPGAAGAWSTTTIDATVEAGGELIWIPEPTILAKDCLHRAQTSVVVERGAHLLWAEHVVFGRSGELPGEYVGALDIAVDGLPVVAQETRCGPHAPEWSGPAVFDDARSTALLISLGHELDPPRERLGVRARTMELDQGGNVLNALGTASGVAEVLRTAVSNHDARRRE